jgi:hypothetical protein
MKSELTGLKDFCVGKVFGGCWVGHDVITEDPRIRARVCETGMEIPPGDSTPSGPKLHLQKLM